MGASRTAPESIEPRSPDPAPQLQPGRLVHVDDVRLSADRTVVSLPFVGAPEFEPTSPCAMDYSAEAELQDEVLNVGVTERTSRLSLPAPPNFGCASVGFGRELTVELDQPFDGSTVRDRSGYTFFVSRPTGLVELSGIPAGWTLVGEEDLPESPTGRWQRSWSSGSQLPRQSIPGRIDLIQAFGGPVNVSGGDQAPSVEVLGEPAMLWTWAATGELVLVWRLGQTSLALVANEADFSIEELVALAKSAEQSE